jgi:hypothetical protein
VLIVGVPARLILPPHWITPHKSANVTEMLRRIWLKADVVVDGIAEPLLAARYRSVVCTLT